MSVIESMVVRPSLDPYCPSLSRLNLSVWRTSRCPHWSFRKKLKSASNRWMILSRFMFGVPESFSIRMLVALLHLGIAIPWLIAMLRNACRHWRRTGQCPRCPPEGEVVVISFQVLNPFVICSVVISVGISSRSVSLSGLAKEARNSWIKGSPVCHSGGMIPLSTSSAFCDKLENLIAS